MKIKHNELKNREIPNIISISEKGLDFNIKQNKKNRITSKESIKKNKDNIMTLEKEKIHKANTFTKKVNKKQNIDKYVENKYLNFHSFFHIFAFILLVKYYHKIFKLHQIK